MTTCPFCNAPVEKRLVERIHRWDGEIRIMRNVPADVCVQCGQTFFEPNALKTMDAVAAGGREPDARLTVPVYSLRRRDFAEARGMLESPQREPGRCSRMAKRIAMFNHKGGGGKTFAAFNLGRHLASMGKRVILVDADPQANLTDLALEHAETPELEYFYSEVQSRNLKEGLAPAFEMRPSLIQPVECFPVNGGGDGLFLLPGHIGTLEYEVLLNMAQELKSSTPDSLRNVPGSLSRLLEKTAEALAADYVLIDTDPSLSAFNQNLLMISDYFVIPIAPDYQSAAAIDTLAKVMPAWSDWARRARESRRLQYAVYPFPKVSAKFIGALVRDCPPKPGVPVKRFQKWAEDARAKMSDSLFPTLESRGMTLPESRYRQAGVDGCILAVIPDLGGHAAAPPGLKDLTGDRADERDDQSGADCERIQKSRAKLERVFSDVARKVIDLTDDARSD